MQTVTTVKGLDAKSELEFLQLQQLQIEIARQKRARIEVEKPIEEQPDLPVSLNHHKAFVEAYPLRQFVEDTFPIVEKGREFKDNWHIDIICELLQATVVGEVRNFLVNIPRRTMKSLLLCVMFPAWLWTFLPHIRFLYTSYSAGFAGRDNKKFWELTKSPYYQQRWGNQFSYTTEKVSKELRNTKGGFRIVFKIGGGTGEGADWVLGDDPNSIEQVESDKILETTNTGWNEVSYHSVTNRNTAVRGIIQQRTAYNDLTGNITEDANLRLLYEHLCLAMRYESDNPLANTFDNPLKLGFVSAFEKSSNSKLKIGELKLWIDPRDLRAPTFDNIWYREWYKKCFLARGLTSKGDGQLLWENYITDKIVREEVAHLKAYGESAQFQQRPITRGGNFFNSANFDEVHIESIDLSELVFVRAFDKGGTEGGGDESVGLLMARTKVRPFTFYIFDVWKGQVGLHNRMEKMVELAKRDTFNYIEPYEDNEYSVFIEKEGGSSGVDLSTLERDALVGYDVQVYNPRQAKAQRAKPAKSASEGGKIKLVKQGFWQGNFIRELEKFDPNKKRNKDNQVDTFAMAFNFLCFMHVTSAGKPSAGVI